MVRNRHLQLLAEESTKLNDLTDNLNELILETESAIFKASPGFAFFGRPIGIVVDRECIHRIGWCKYVDPKDKKMRWQLVLAWEKTDIDSEFTHEPHTSIENTNVIGAVTKCARDIRLVIYEHLDEFIQDLTNEVKHKAEMIKGLCDKSIKLV